MAQKTFNNTKINVEFDEATSRQQLNSGENISTLFGKVKKIFSDLKAVCFSGSYIDLSDIPTTATTEADGLMSASDKTKLDNADDTYALKSKYGDTTINVGRKAGTDVGERSTAEGYNTTASGGNSHSEGLNTTASGAQSHAEGVETIASGSRSHAEGVWTIASGGSNHAEGKETTANGNNSCHAEGSKTTASGIATHAEGNSSNKVTDLITDFSWNGTTNDDIINAWNTQKFSVAHGRSSHVEGSDNLTLGHSSHAEGCCTVAIGDQSHTSGYFTKALHDNEAAYGKYNESNENTLFSIGDGTADDARHNAFEITTTGGKLHDKNIVTDDMSLPANGGNADTVNGHSVEADVPANAVFTDTKVTSPSNHYTPVKSITKSASGGTLTDIANSTLGTQVVTGVEMDAKGHVTGVVSTALKTSVPVIVSLTRNEYDSLATKDPNTYYMITDDVGDMSDAVVLNVGKDKEFTSFTSAMWVAAGISDQKVVVNVFAGEYDVYSELGGDNYIIGIGSSEWRDIQPLLSGNVEIKGIGNVVLKLEIPDNIYTNNKTNCEKVSTISTERNILVENITFVNKNCRYSIHDECGNSEGAANTKHIFRNCRFYNDNTISCIGVGTVTGYFEVENCYTENTTTGSFFLHDWVKSTGGNLIIKNCVFNSESGIDVILSVNSNPESVFDVYLSNNIFEKLAITGVNTSQFSTNVFRVIGVHNTITTTAVNSALTNPYPIKLY